MKARISVALLVPQLVRSHPAGSVTCAMVEDLCDEIDFTVYGSKIDPGLLGRVNFVPLHIPTGRPFLFGYIAQFLIYGLLVKGGKLSVKHDIIHSVEAVAPYTHLMTMHFCAPAVRKLTSEHAIVRRGWRRSYYWLATLWGAFTERFAIRNPLLKALVTVSDGLKKEVLSFDKPAVQVISIPNYADLNRYKAVKTKRAEERSRLGLTGDEIVGVITAAGDWERKGLAHLVRAVAEAQNSSIRIIVVGAGPVERYEKMCEIFGVNSKFLFVGYAKEPERYYAAADFFVLPSAYETFSLVAWEAAAAGLPILGCATNGIDELIEEGRSGFFITRDAGKIANVLDKIAIEKDRLEGMGARAKLKAKEYSRQRMSDSYRKLYQSLAGARCRVSHST